VRVLIIEDDPRYREGLETLFKHTPGIELAASYADARDALRTLERGARLGDAAPADVVVTDLEMPHVDGIEGTRRLKALWPDLPVVVVTVFEEPATILKAICAGADGYLLKSTSARELIAPLRAVTAGGAPMTAGVARTVLGLLRSQPGPAIQAQAPSRLDLTEREQEVLRCLVNGNSYKQTAGELGVSIDTVRTHIRRLYKKLQVHSVAEAVSRAIREGLV